ncbi:MAG: H+-translocating transhydrogenase subunit alpha [Frankiaceae bacterium]|nr:H+-translocating transhydrogenase subunit alpha [Frankiaceae bacterium]
MPTVGGVRVAVVAETAPGERRVAVVPEAVRRLVGAGWAVAVERGAGRQSFVADDDYTAAGAEVVGDRAALVGGADVVLSAQPVPVEVLGAVAAGTTVVSLLAPSTYPDHIRTCRDRGLTAFALELVPRISRAQSMDVLSSQALVAGYRAALTAAALSPDFFPLAVTAAGTVPPAKVLVLGTGVAGLSAIATARRLGAETWAYDVRPSSAEEVASLGATFLPLELAGEQDAGGYARASSEAFLASQRELLSGQIGGFDVVITTAAVPGHRAPLLLTTAMVEQMRPGSVVVDLAAESGGNCELTEPGREVEHHGVLISGRLHVASELPRQASELFSRNMANLLLLMTEDGTFAPDFTDEIVAGCCVTRDGGIVSATPAPSAAAAEPPSPGSVRRTTAEAVAALLSESRRVVIVPGYGLAVAQAQHVVRGLDEVLRRRGVEVSYAVHPVAGRMPGQLNVLLAEANVPRESIDDLEQAAGGFSRADVVLVVGADDVVNPAARTGGTALSGMPVFDVASARHVVVLKRSLRPGFAGVGNALLADEKTTVLLGDAKETVLDLLVAVRSS